ncbi:MAG: PAS domain S-box protein [Bacteroidales bacterium]|nr:PAS domain S-box protein [Bacteroidales bacterium]
MEVFSSPGNIYNGRVVCIQCDNRGVVTYVSPNVYSLLQIYPNQITGKKILSFTKGYITRRFLLLANKCRQENTSEGLSFSWENSDKKVIDLSIQLSYNPSQGYMSVLMPYYFLPQQNEKYKWQKNVLRNTLESIDDFVFLLDSKGRFSDFYSEDNDLKFNNINNSFKPGNSLTDAGFPSEVEAAFLDVVNKVITSGNSEELLYEMEAFGSKLFYHARISPNYNFDKKIDGVIVVSRDITTLVNSELKLKQSVSYYLTVFDNFPTLIWRCNRYKKIDYINKTLQNFTGRTLDQDRGDGWQQAIHPEDCERVVSEYIRKFDHKKPFIQEYRILHHSGEYRWVKDFLNPIFDYKGRFSGYIGNCIDINDIRRTQKLLQDSELRYRELFDNVPDIVFSLDGNGKIRKINKAAGIILGYNSLEGKRIWDLLLPRERRSVYRHFEKVISDDKNSFSFEIKVIDSKSEIKYLQLKGFLNFDSENGIAEVYGIARDITIQKMLEKSILKNTIATEERERRRFAEDLHDGIGPLLSGLKMYLQKDSLMVNLESKQIKILTYCRDLVDEAIRQTRSIANNLTPGILNDFGLEKALTSHISKINAIGKFKVNLHISKSPVILEEETSLAIFRVVSELLNNSLKHSDCSKVEIVMDEKNDILSVNYSDNGKGFDPLKAHHANGGKMGLNNIRNRINSLNGSVSFNSQEGKGLFVKIFLPVK